MHAKCVSRPPRLCGIGMLLQKESVEVSGNVICGDLRVIKLVQGLPASQSGLIGKDCKHEYDAVVVGP